MQKVFVGEEKQNTEQQKKPYSMPGNMPIETEKPKKEILDDFGKFKLMLLAVSWVFLIVNLLPGLKKNKIELDRKILSQLAQNQPEIFEKIVEKVKS